MCCICTIDFRIGRRCADVVIISGSVCINVDGCIVLISCTLCVCMLVASYAVNVVVIVGVTDVADVIIVFVVARC